MKKKVILYNTHLNGLMNYGEAQIAKMRQVFEYFAGRKDMVLWWRPHPLSRETLGAMNNRILAEYDQLVREYRERNIGIYDDEMDVHRAIAIADAYYGDSSSVVAMFAVTGKPMLRQDVRCNIDAEQAVPLGFGGCVLWANRLYVSSAFFSGLLCWDPDSGSMKYLKEFPESSFYRLSYHLFEKEDGRLIFGPFKGSCILEYGLKDGEFKTYAIPVECGLEPMYFKSVRYGEDLFMISHKVGQILRYHMKTHEVFVCAGWYDELLGNRERVNPYIFMGEVVVKGDNFFMASSAVNAILEFHMIDGTFTVHSVGKTGEAFSNLAYDGKQFWMATLKGEIYRWDGKGKSEKLTGLPHRFKAGNYPAFWKMVYTQNHIYVFPAYSNMILNIDCEKSSIQCFYELEYEKKSRGYEEKYSKYQYADLMETGKILAYSYYENCIQIIDPLEGTITRIALNLCDSDKKVIAEHNPFSDPLPGLWREDGAYQEGWPITLPAFLDYVAGWDKTAGEAQTELYKGRFSNMDGTCGEKIWRAVKTLLSDGTGK